MKGKEIIIHAVRAEMPDIEHLKENSIKKATEKRAVKQHSVMVKRFIPAAACLAILLVISIVSPHIINGDFTPNTTSGDKNNPTVELAMRGLPVENFNLADLEINNLTMKRIVLTSFGDILKWATCFAVVKVNDIQSIKANGFNSFGTQVSNLTVLQGVYGCGDFSEPFHIKISQSIIKNHFCLGTTNLLRKDGVYLLPLKKTDDQWYIIGAMDVLFEIDDKGKVWSHSDFEDFNRHDGKSIDAFIKDLSNMFSDEDFMLANSPFAATLRGQILADITINSEKEVSVNQYGETYFNYEFAFNEILYDPNHIYSATLSKTRRLTFYAKEKYTIPLIAGKRYLLCLSENINDFKNDFIVKSWRTYDDGSPVAAGDSHTVWTDPPLYFSGTDRPVINIKRESESDWGMNGFGVSFDIPDHNSPTGVTASAIYFVSEDGKSTVQRYEGTMQMEKALQGRPGVKKAIMISVGNGYGFRYHYEWRE